VAGEAKYKDISWFSPNGEKLTPNQQRISVVRNDDFSSTLTIYNANIDDAGIYKCVVSSVEEGDSEATVNVKIYRKRTTPGLLSGFFPADTWGKIRKGETPYLPTKGYYCQREEKRFKREC